jgi:two-component system sensor histidine kinase UhpB
MGGDAVKLSRLQIVGVYAVCAGLWIVLSDRFVTPHLPVSQTGKGLFFVAATTLLLYVLIGEQRRVSRRQTLDRLDELTESVGIGLALFRRDEGAILWTKAASELTHIEKESALGVSLVDLLDRLGISREVLELADDAGDVATLSGIEVDGRILQASVAQAENGLTLLTMEDETEREQLIRQLEATRERYARAERIGRIGHWSMDLETEDLRWSPQVYEIFGVDPERKEVDLEEFRSRVHLDDRDELHSIVMEAASSSQGFEYEHRIVRPDGEVRWVREVGAFDADEVGEPTMVRGTVQDVSERVEAERTRREHAERIQRLAQAVTVAQEEERERLAREIHDELGQAMTGLSFGLRALRDQVDERARETVSELEEEVRQATVAIGEIAASLRPPLLDQFGLKASLEQLCDKAESTFALTCDFVDITGEWEIEPNDAIQVYRIVQEALTNVARHAGADRAELRIEERTGERRVVVEDNGRGFDADAERKDGSLGIQGMAERADLIGATLDIESMESGTTVTLAMPANGKGEL